MVRSERDTSGVVQARRHHGDGGIRRRHHRQRGINGIYAAPGRLGLRGLLSWQRVHGGLRGGAGPPPPEGFPFGDITSAELFAQHDRLLQDNHFHAGFGAAWEVPRLGLELFGSYVGFVKGTNAHAGRSITVGVSRPFGR